MTRLPRPNPALILANGAQVLSLCGGARAGTVHIESSTQLEDDVVVSRVVAPGAVSFSKLDGDLRDRLPARYRWARVTAAGAVISAEASGVTAGNVERRQPSATETVYCLRDLDPVPDQILVTPDATGLLTAAPNSAIGRSHPRCPAGTQGYVEFVARRPARDPNGLVADDNTARGFYLLLVG
jgi:hypothetical protein